jgi:sterol desaturase/sphingolipid hydroxylase (fatty acid hydroxylase superfamily)
MDTFVTFFRHPIEIIADSMVLIIIGKILLGISFEVMLAILIVESSLELFHHSNIQIPSWIRPLGYVIQIPEQHLIHHQKGLHKWNYGTLTLWDSLFGTLRFNKHWSHTVGLNQWREVKRILLYRY